VIVMKELWSYAVSFFRKIKNSMLPSSQVGTTPDGFIPSLPSENPKSLDPMSRKEELKAQAPFINALGFDPMIVYVHAYHESGNFKHIIGNYNFWGIKKPKNWTGKTILITTHEYIHGVKTELKDYFIDFPDMKGAIIWYAEFIGRMYPQAYTMRDNYKGYFPALVNYAHQYATDPMYYKKLIALYEELKPIENIS
jgi:flagellum-specific peptidoglycan hydrolase FlgJ